MSKFISPEKPPEGIERELLIILMEEAAEVIQRASKALRFGVNEIQEGQPLTNAERVVYEMADLDAVLSMLVDRGTLDPRGWINMKMAKQKKVQKYLQSNH